MKTTKEILGLKIISILDGTDVGSVKDIVLNPEKGSLDFFILDQPSDYFGAKLIAFKDVLGVGEFAVTIPNPSVIQDASHNEGALELLKRDVKVVGTKVLSKKGKLLGQVKELIIDEDEGLIAECIFHDQSGVQLNVKSSDVITLGKELLIVEELPEHMANSVSAKPELQAPISHVKNVPSDSENPVIDEAENAEEAFNAFEKRQLEYFVGKATSQDVVLDNGDILPAGQVMTRDDLKNVTSRETLRNITAQIQK